jgi:hypothetical protein
MSLAAFSPTVPVGLTHGAAQVTVKLAVPVIDDIGSLKAAVIMVLLVATPVALLTGATAVTVGGTTGVTGLAPVPRMGDCPAPPPPHPAANMLNSSAMHHDRTLEPHFRFLIFIPLLI